MRQDLQIVLSQIEAEPVFEIQLEYQGREWDLVVSTLPGGQILSSICDGETVVNVWKISIETESLAKAFLDVHFRAVQEGKEIGKADKQLEIQHALGLGEDSDKYKPPLI